MSRSAGLDEVSCHDQLVWMKFHVTISWFGCSFMPQIAALAVVLCHDQLVWP